MKINTGKLNFRVGVIALDKMYLSLPPLFVIIGSASIIVATILFGVNTLQIKMTN